MNKLFYITPCRNKNNADISIKLTQYKPADKRSYTRICFTFRNSIWEKIASTTQCLQFAVKDNKLFFVEVAREDGWLMRRYDKQGTSRYLSISGDAAEEITKRWSRFSEGDYFVEYDEKYKLFYIGGNE